MLQHAINKRNNMKISNSTPVTAEDFVKLYYQFQQLMEVEREFRRYPITIEDQVEYFDDWFLKED